MTGGRQDADKYSLRIEDLAKATGATVRNIRVYQEKGLLPPPVRKGRTALYGPQHRRRLQVVLRLLDRGYTFATIDELFTADRLGLSLGDLIAAEDTRQLRRSRPKRRTYLLSEAHALVGYRFSDKLLQAGNDIGVSDGTSMEQAMLTDGQIYDLLSELVRVGLDESDINSIATRVFEGLDHAAAAFETVIARLRDNGYSESRSVSRASDLVEQSGRVIRLLFQNAAHQRIMGTASGTPSADD